MVVNNLLGGVIKLVIHHTKRFVVAVIGGTIILIGIAMLVLPGPGTLVIIAGLAVLATEFFWAKRWLGEARLHYDKVKDRVTKPQPSID